MQNHVKKVKYAKNIRNLLKFTNESDFEHGADWYKNARLFCFNISKTYNVSFRKTCAILAALSPRNKWNRNKLDTENFIRYYCDSTLDFIPKYSTYSNMVKKAHAIFNAPNDDVKTMLALLNGPKIKSFFLNVYDSNSQCVTVDSWVQLVSLGKYLNVNARPSLKLTDYKLIESVIRDMATIIEVRPAVLQAVLWVSFKRKMDQNDYN